MNIIKKIFGFCQNCETWFVYPKRRRMHTNYADDEKNFNTLCKDCYKRENEMWDSLWDEIGRTWNG